MKGNPLIVFPDFRRLFISRVISAIGDKFFTLSLMWWVISLPDGKFGLSLAMVATFLPIVIFSPIMGTIADRHNKKYLMLLADFLRALFLAVILLLFIYQRLSLPLLLIFVFLIYTFSPLFETSVSSSLLSLTSESALASATAIDSSSIGISNVIGAMLGSILIASIGFKGAIQFNILTYLCSFAFVLTIRKKLKTSEQEIKSHYIDDLKAGFVYLYKSKKNILKLLIFFAVLNFFVSPIMMLIPVTVKFILDEDVKWLAIIETFFASGVLVGSVVMSLKKTVSGNVRILIYTIFLLSLAFFSTAYINKPLITSIMFFLIGFSISVGNVSIISYFQYNIENEYKGRFFSLVNTVVYAIMPLSFVVNGFLLDCLSPATVIIINSIASLVIGVFGLIKFSD